MYTIKFKKKVFVAVSLHNRLNFERYPGGRSYFDQITWLSNDKFCRNAIKLSVNNRLEQYSIESAAYQIYYEL
jgi:hypothetical protein